MTKPLIWPAVIFMVHRKPRTVTEIHELTGHTKVHISRVLKAAEREGLVNRARPGKPLGGERGGSVSAVWTWQP